jgi:FixJ family two-component response regulator
MESSETNAETAVAPANTTPTVYVVDDDVSVREALEALLVTAGWHPLVFSSAQEFLQRGRNPGPSCLVLDVSLPDLNGLDLQTQLADRRMDMPIIFITGYGDVPTTVRAMKAGAVEFMTKPFDDGLLLEAVRSAIQKSSVALGQAGELQLLTDRYASLSRRECQVFELVIRGTLNKQIGAALGISEITVKAHRGRVMRKMKASSLADLVNIGSRLGIAAGTSKS